MANAWRRSSLLSPKPLAGMFDAAIGRLTTTSGDRRAIDAFVALPDDPEVSVTGPDGRGVADRLVAALSDDPANADRVTDAAVALWARGVLGSVGETDEGDEDEADVSSYADAAIVVLEAAKQRYPDHRALLLDLALFKSVTPGWDHAGAEEAAAALALDPTDVTARALLANLQATDPVPRCRRAGARHARAAARRPGDQGAGRRVVGRRAPRRGIDPARRRTRLRPAASEPRARGVPTCRCGCRGRGRARGPGACVGAPRRCRGCRRRDRPGDGARVLVARPPRRPSPPGPARR